jgi:hypothetical protein
MYYEATARFGTGEPELAAAGVRNGVTHCGLCEPDSESQSTCRPPGFGLIMARARGLVRTRMLKVSPSPLKAPHYAAPVPLPLRLMRLSFQEPGSGRRRFLLYPGFNLNPDPASCYGCNSRTRHYVHQVSCTSGLPVARAP